MWLWNWIMPAIFDITKISWIQAWGLTLLCKILFKPITYKSVIDASSALNTPNDIS